MDKTQDDLWRSIPPSSNLFDHEVLVGTTLGVDPFFRRVSSCETKSQISGS